MSDWDELAVAPERVVSHGGKPAACVPEFAWPAYESENRVQYVMESVAASIAGKIIRVVERGTRWGDRLAAVDELPELYIPFSYATAVALAPSGLTALHHDKDAMWTWRPRISEIRRDGTWSGFSSQHELEWRIAASQLAAAVAEDSDALSAYVRWLWYESGYDGWARGAALGLELTRLISGRTVDGQTTRLPYVEANARAEKLLRSMLSPQQRLDFDVHGMFLVRGTINRCYEVCPNDAVYIVEPETGQRRVSLCLHPDEWIPGCDVALAFKLAVEGGVDGEEEMLRAAKATLRFKHREPTAEQRYAWQLEKPMLPVKIIVEHEEDADGDPDQVAVGLDV